MPQLRCNCTIMNSSHRDSSEECACAHSPSKISNYGRGPLPVGSGLCDLVIIRCIIAVPRGADKFNGENPESALGFNFQTVSAKPVTGRSAFRSQSDSAGSASFHGQKACTLAHGKDASLTRAPHGHSDRFCNCCYLGSAESKADHKDCIDTYHDILGKTQRTIR